MQYNLANVVLLIFSWISRISRIFIGSAELKENKTRDVALYMPCGHVTLTYCNLTLAAAKKNLFKNRL